MLGKTSNLSSISNVKIFNQTLSDFPSPIHSEHSKHLTHHTEPSSPHLNCILRFHTDGPSQPASVIPGKPN